MSRTLPWRELKTGIVALAVLVGLALGVLLFARVGALHGDTSDLYVLTAEAPGVLNGTEVWLSGEKVGLVKDIHFRSVTTDTLQRLAIHTQILADRMHLIRKDAYADIRPGGNLIGSPVVWISSGTSTAPALASGDTLIEVSTGKMKPVSERVTALGARVTMLADSGGRVLALLKSQMRSLGELGSNGLPRIATTSRQMSALLGKSTTGQGSLAMISQGDLGRRVARIRATKDSITRLMSSGGGNVARFRTDSALQKTVAHLTGELDSLRSAFAGAGALTRARSDTALASEMARIRIELAALMADLKKHPRQYIGF